MSVIEEMIEEEAYEKALKLVNNSEKCLLGTIDENGYPNIKAMYNAKNNGIKEIWFSTNTSSIRTELIKNNEKTCVYFVDMENFIGVMLVGKTIVSRDKKLREMLWDEDSIKFYPLGIDDPDYSVLYFKSEKGNIYHSLKKGEFEIK